MEQSQHSADHLITETGEPAGLSRRQVLQVAPQHLDEHQLAQSGEDAVGARPAETELFGVVALNTPARRGDTRCAALIQHNNLESVDYQAPPRVEEAVAQPLTVSALVADEEYFVTQSGVAAKAHTASTCTRPRISRV
jgi:hypothetical protein